MSISKIIAAVTQVSPDDIGIPKVPINETTLQGLLTITFTAIGGMAVLFLLVGAVRYITSNGDQGKITQAKNTILYAIIGMVVSLMGFTIVQFVLGGLRGL